MTKETSIKLFEEKKVRTLWNEEQEEWYFSVVDVVGILTDSENPRRYWSDLKIKLENEGSQLYENIVQLKLPAQDGKMRLTDVASTEQIFRIIQSIPSPKAEPFKQWLAMIAKDARLKLEAETGKKVVSPLNAKNGVSIESKDRKEIVVQ